MLMTMGLRDNGRIIQELVMQAVIFVRLVATLSCKRRV